jgi:hypothetical protein
MVGPPGRFRMDRQDRITPERTWVKWPAPPGTGIVDGLPNVLAEAITGAHTAEEFTER